MTLISREDAIERIANDNVVGGMERINEYRDSTEHNDYLDGISTAIATVDDLPSDEAEWIPCSERLPDVGRDVLFCDSKWTEEGCLRADGDWYQFRWSTVMPKEKVTAWMPLPKPYREDGEA